MQRRWSLVCFITLLGTACVPLVTVATPSPTIATQTSSAAASVARGATRTVAPVPAENPADLVIRLETVSDACCPVTQAVLVADGRFVTRTDDQQLRERTLTPAGVERVRTELSATGLFESDRRFPLEARPGVAPPARGIGSLLFKVWRDTRSVVVTTANDQGPDEAFFQPSAARTRLTRLSEQLRAPETWLPAEAWRDAAPRPYDARLFVLLIRGESGLANVAPTIAALGAAWPFSIGPLTLGQMLPPEAGPQAENARCSVLTKDDMLLVRDAMLQAGAAAAMDTAPDGTVQAPFFVAQDQPGLWVTLRPLLPDRASCKGEYVF